MIFLTGAGGTEGGIYDIDQLSDESQSDLDISSSDDDGAFDLPNETGKSKQKKQIVPKFSMNSALKLH